MSEKIILTIVAISCILFTNGCSSAGRQARTAGKAACLSYMIGRDKLSEIDRTALLESHKIFSYELEELKLTSDESEREEYFLKRLRGEADKRIENKSLRVRVKAVMTGMWFALNKRHDLDNMSFEERVEVLSEFNDGVISTYRKLP